MQSKEKKYNFNDVITFDSLGEEAVNKFQLLNSSIYGSSYGFSNEKTKELLVEIYSELDDACAIIEGYIREYSYDVEYYKNQSIALNTIALREQAVLSQFKMNLLTSRLFYLSNIRSAISLVLNKKNEMQLKK